MKNGKMNLTPDRILVKGRDGFFVVNPKDVYVGGAIITYGEFSHLEMDLFEKLLTPKTTMIEVGANIGAHTVGLAKLCDRVIAFEPQPEIFHNLVTNIFINQIRNVKAIQAGVGMFDSCMYVPDINYSETGNFGGVSLTKAQGGTKVDIFALDTYLQHEAFERLFIKIDVEGMELDVLLGSRHVVDMYKPIMYIENDRPEKSADLIQFLKEILDYDLYWHTPYLYNTNNYFGKKENKYPGIVSVNMLCVPKGSDMHLIDGLVPVTTDKHPMFG